MPPDETRPLSTRRYWPQWSLRGMFLLTAVCAVVAGVYLAPRIRERAALDWLRKIEARVTTETIGPGWLARLIGEKYLERAVAVDLSGHELTDDDLRRLKPLRNLRRLDLSGISLTDRSLDRLPRFEWLEELSLVRSNISDAGLARLATLPSLTRLRLAGSKVTLAAAERTVRRRPHLELDAALGDALYQNTWHLQTTYKERKVRPLPLRELIFRCQTAASWKLAWARLKDDRQAEADAHRQQIAWLKKYATQTGGPSRAAPPLGIEGESAWLDCVIAEAEADLAQTLEEPENEKSARGRAIDAARHLEELMSANLESGAIDPFEFDRARETATRILLADAQMADDARLAQEVLAEAAEQYQKLTDRTRALYDKGMPGGEAERLALAEMGLALAQARLLGRCDDHDGERMALKDAAALASKARGAAEASYKAGTITVCDLLEMNGRAGELRLAQAHAEGDHQAERASAAVTRLFFISTWRRVNALDFADLRYAGGALLRCLYGIDQLERRGRDFYEGPVCALEPSLPDISLRVENPNWAGRACEAAHAYLEQQQGLPMGAAFTVEMNREGYDVMVEPIAGFNRDGQPFYSLRGQRIVVLSIDFKVLRVIDGE